MSSSRRHGGWRHGARHHAARRLSCYTEEMPFEMETYDSLSRPSPTSSIHRGRSGGACLDAARRRLRQAGVGNDTDTELDIMQPIVYFVTQGCRSRWQPRARHHTPFINFIK
uniref:Uncharacterized protein n=1 Tax=Triticum urartu TaxID=4572 RepID=A0A8R7PJM3_TRIUA